jgi:predicted transcriptional regulator
MADWLLAQVEQGHFVDPSDAVFAIVKNFIDMEPHRDLRDELLRRILDESVARGLEDVKAGRVRPADEVFDALRRSWRSPLRAGPLAEDRTMNQLAPCPRPRWRCRP